MPRILISYVTAGAGHQRAAEALAEAVGRTCPDADVACEDLLGHTPSWFTRTYPGIYEWAVRYAPWLWGASYRLFDHPFIYRLVQPWRRRWNRWIGKTALRAVRQHPPQVILTTHFFAADLYAQAKREGWLTARLIVVVTDLFPHRFWLAPEADQFVVGSERSAVLCRQRGIEASRVHPLGIPIRAMFRRVEGPAREALQRRLDLEPGRRTVLIVSGGMGVGPIGRLAKHVATLEDEQPGRMQMLVVCGHNWALERQLAAFAGQTKMPMRVYGFTEAMHELMAVSDVIVSKPGGLTLAETLAMGLPLVILGAIPGQEELNAQELVRHGSSVQAHTVDEAVAWVRRLCDGDERVATMRECALAWGKPDAAEQIAKLVGA